MDKKSLAERLQLALERTGLSQTDLKRELEARGINVTTQAVSEWFTGNSKPKADKFLPLSQVLRVNWPWLQLGNGPMEAEGEEFILPVEPKEARAPAAGVTYRPDGAYTDAELLTLAKQMVWVPLFAVRVAAGHGREVLGERVVALNAYRREWLVNRKGMDPLYVANVMVWGDSMRGEGRGALDDGDMILMDLRATSVADAGIYVLQVSSNGNAELIVKQVQRLGDGSLLITSKNPAYQPITVAPDRLEEYRVVGRAFSRTGDL